ncbi:MAG: 30S ribosomal protein S17 [Candidatus Marinimicrobia bacterium]|nr:30S ribosomal protein S17 [Candidatus Neomarinimicrobiota bacterium]
MAATKLGRRRLTGEVLKTKMDKTAVVQVTRRFAHPMYKKYVTKSKRYYAHDEQNVCRDGDQVIIEATRPLSRLKRWRVVEVTRPAAVVEVTQ